MIDLYKTKFKNHRNFCVIFLLLTCFYFILVGHYPAARPHDSIAYLAYSDLIVQSFSTGDFAWARELSLEAGDKSWTEWQWSKPTTYRMIGYPLVIVGAKFFGGDNFEVWLQAFQSIATLVVIILVYITALNILKNKGWAIVGALSYAFSPAIYLQNAVLTDSLYSNLLATVFCLTVISFYRNSDMYLRCLIIGISLAVAFLIREVTAVIIIVFVPVLILSLWYSKLPKLKKWISALLIALPLCSAYVGYGLWNDNRSGVFFMTLNHPPYSLFTKLRQGVPVFSYGEPLDAAAKKTIREFNTLNNLPLDSPPTFLVTETIGFVGRLFEVMDQDFGYDQHDMFRAISGRAVRLLIDHPVQAIKFAFDEMMYGNPNGFPPVMGMVFSPFTEIALLEQMSGTSKQGRSIMSVVRIIQSGDFTAMDVVECVVRIIFRLIPLGIFLLYLAFVPVWLFFMPKKDISTTLIMASIWCVFAGMSCVYSLFHFEVRYVLGALPSQILSALLSAQFFVSYFLEKYKKA